MQTQTEIRAQIIQELERSLSEGRIVWRKPWVGHEGPRLPTNFVTKTRYSGVNTMLTFAAEARNNWPISYWATFNQFRSIGCHIRKGERATKIIYFTYVKKFVKDRNGDEVEKSIPIFRVFSIFNISQAQGPAIDQFHAQPVLRTFDDNRSEFDAVVNATGARIDQGHEIAAYLTLEDRIIMPDVGRFDSWPDYAATTFHEIAHWSQPKTRLNIEGSYSENELFAEITSSYLMAAVGIPHGDDLRNTKAYIQSWAATIKESPKALFAAASKASLATDYILSFSRGSDASAAESVEEEAATA